MIGVLGPAFVLLFCALWDISRKTRPVPPPDVAAFAAAARPPDGAAPPAPGPGPVTVVQHREWPSGAASAAVPALRVSVAGAPGSATTHPLVGASSGRCLDVYDNRTAPGTKTEIWDCNGGANQQWRLG